MSRVWIENITNIPTVNLVAIFNTFSKKRVEMWKDRQAAELHAIQAVNDCKSESLGLFNVTVSTMHPHLSQYIKEKKYCEKACHWLLQVEENILIGAYMEMANRTIGISQDVPIRAILDYMKWKKDDSIILFQYLARLKQSELIIRYNQKDCTLADHALIWAANTITERHRVSIAADKKRIRDAKPLRIPTDYKGKRIYKLVEDKPRVLSNDEWKCWRIMLSDGMTYEEYIHAGGTKKHLDYNVHHNFLEVREDVPSTTPPLFGGGKAEGE